MFTNESWQLWIWGRFPPSKCPTMAEKQTICCWSYLDLKKKRMTVHKSCITMVITSSASVYYRPGDGERLALKTAPFKVGQTFNSLAPGLDVMLEISQCNYGWSDIPRKFDKLKPPCFFDRTLTCLEPLLLRVHWLPLPLPLAGPCTNLFGRIYC